MTTRPTGRLVVCDPCLGTVGTHPWACAAALLDAARRAGWRGDLVARRGFVPPAGAPCDFAIHPLLRFPGTSRLTATAELDRLEGRSRGGWRPPWDGVLRAARRRVRAAAFASDLRALVASLRPGDQFLVATASELDALGLARTIADTRAPVGIGWHLCFHAPLLVAGAGATADARLRRVRTLLGRAIRGAAPHRLRFWATTPELAAEWRLGGAASAGVLPTPVLAPPSPAASATEGRPLRIALLGDARAEKGFHVVGDLLDRVAADPTLAGGLRFAIQTNPGFDRRSRRTGDVAVAEALERVAAHRGGLVDDLGGPLEPDAYRMELARADALLLPYDPRRYHHRCSGVLLEAMAAGKVALVTAGGWMARRLLPAHRDHAERLLALHPALAEERHTAIDLPSRGEARRRTSPPAGADTLLIEATWTRPALRAGTDLGAAFDAALRVRLWPGCVPATVVLAAGGDGRPTPAVVRVAAPAAGSTISLDAQGPDDGVRVESLVLRWLRCGGEPPLGAVGIVVPDPSVESASAALGELVAHRAHYRAGAAAAAADVARAHSPSTVLETLLA